MARQFNRLDSVAESIIEEVGGDGSAKILFKGKIVAVERTLKMGHIHGEVIIEGTDSREEAEKIQAPFHGKLKIPFKNENIAAIKIEDDGSENVSIIRSHSNFG